MGWNPMGDGVMIWSPDAGRALALAADAVDELGTRRDLLPVRIGVHTGPALMRGCDWYGNSVNVAARLADVAGCNEVLVSTATIDAARGVSGTRPLGSRRELSLRGLRRPISAWTLA